MRLKFNDIKVGNTLLIKGNTITVDSTGIYHIQGSNGCGKTSLLLGIKAAYADCSTLMIQENIAIDSKNCITNNISMFQEDTKSNNILKKYGFEYLLHNKSKYLSGGEKRLISLLRCLLSPMPLILLDEPFNDLDYMIIEKTNRLLKEIGKHKLIIIVSHHKVDIPLKGKYLITDKNVILQEHITSSSLATLELKSVRLKEYKIKANYFPIMSIIIFCLYLFYCINNLNIEENFISSDKNAYITSERSTFLSDRINEGAVAIDKLNCNLKMFVYCDESENDYTDYDMTQLPFTIYPLEFFNKKENSYKSLGSYISEKFFEFKEIVIKDHSDILKTKRLSVVLPKDIKFSSESRKLLQTYDIAITYDDVEEIEMTLNNRLYKEFYFDNKAKKDNLIIDALIDERVTPELIMSLGVNNHLYIKGEFINSLLIESNKVLQLKSLIVKVSIALLILYTINIIYAYILIKINGTLAKLLYMYGYNKKNIYCYLKKANLIQYIKYVIGICLIIIYYQSSKIGILNAILIYIGIVSIVVSIFLLLNKVLFIQ